MFSPKSFMDLDLHFGVFELISVCGVRQLLVALSDYPGVPILRGSLSSAC